MAATYGTTLEAVENEQVLAAWERREKLTLGPAQHGFSAAYRAALAGLDQPLPADQWLRRFAKASGLRKDARAWYAVEPWLDSLCTKPVAASAILERLEEREFDLEVSWPALPFQDDDTLTVSLPVNPSSHRVFESIHNLRIPNVLLHVKLGNLDGRSGPLLLVKEVQSDWHQEGSQSGWYADPIVWQRQQKDRQRTLEEASYEASDTVVGTPALLGALAPAITKWLGRPALPDDPDRCGPVVWQFLRALSDGEVKLPQATAKSLVGPAGETLAKAVATFQERNQACRNHKLSPVPLAPFQSDWPRLGLTVALAYAAVAKAPDGQPLFQGIRLAEGEAAAAASLADEGVSSLAWASDARSGEVRLQVETQDSDGNTSWRPEIRVPRDQLLQLGHMEELCARIDGLIAAGKRRGSFSRAWMEKTYYADWLTIAPPAGVLWRNMPLRRFYDGHLPRELREVARGLGCASDGPVATIGDQARATLAERFAGFPAHTPDDDALLFDADGDLAARLRALHAG